MEKTLKRRILLLIALLAALTAPCSLVAEGTRTEITGTGVAVQIASSGTARWVQVIADAANTAAVRTGDSTVNSTSGAKIAPGGGFMRPPQGALYGLQSIYVFVATGDKVSVLWGNN